MTHYCRRILIVEDEEILAQNLRDFLLRRKAEVCIAPSAEAALDEIGRFRPDCVVLDYSLPGMNGLEAFAHLRAGNPTLRGALISGHPTEQLRDVAARAGIEHVLTKPFSFAELERVLRAWHSDHGEGPGEALPPPENARRTDRRRAQEEPSFPLGTPEGWVLEDRRARERRTPGPGLVAEFAAGLASN